VRPLALSLVLSLRPSQWTKNLIIFAALMFGQRLLDVHAVLSSIAAFAIFCALLGHRPPPKRTPWGGQQRIAALKLKGIYDDDGGLWHRTLDEIDACAAAYAAYALTVGVGTWVGDPAEGVMVIPTTRLLARYAKLPAPARSGLA